jgi:hypothetical protein
MIILLLQPVSAVNKLPDRTVLAVMINGRLTVVSATRLFGGCSRWHRLETWINGEVCVHVG